LRVAISLCCQLSIYGYLFSYWHAGKALYCQLSLARKAENLTVCYRCVKSVCSVCPCKCYSLFVIRYFSHNAMEISWHKIWKITQKNETQTADKAHSSIADTATKIRDMFITKASHKRISHLTFSCGLTKHVWWYFFAHRDRDP